MRLVATTRDDHASGIGKLAQVKVDPGVCDAFVQLRKHSPHRSVGGAEVQHAKRRPVGQKASPTVSPISRGLGGSQWVWMGQKPLVALDCPHYREGGNLSRNA